MIKGRRYYVTVFAAFWFFATVICVQENASSNRDRKISRTSRIDSSRARVKRGKRGRETRTRRNKGKPVETWMTGKRSRRAAFAPYERYYLDSRSPGYSRFSLDRVRTSRSPVTSFADETEIRHNG